MIVSTNDRQPRNKRRFGTLRENSDFDVCKTPKRTDLHGNSRYDNAYTLGCDDFDRYDTNKISTCNRDMLMFYSEPNNQSTEILRNMHRKFSLATCINETSMVSTDSPLCKNPIHFRTNINQSFEVHAIYKQLKHVDEILRDLYNVFHDVDRSINIYNELKLKMPHI